MEPSENLLGRIAIPDERDKLIRDRGEACLAIPTEKQ